MFVFGLIKSKTCIPWWIVGLFLVGNINAELGGWLKETLSPRHNKKEVSTHCCVVVTFSFESLRHCRDSTRLYRKTMNREDLDMSHTKTSMDAASYALWQELRASCIQAEKLKTKAIYGTACCLLWLATGLLFGKFGLLCLVLLWFFLYLGVGVGHLFLAHAKDDWPNWFAPAFYRASPLIGFLMLLILSGKNLASISRDIDEGHGYLFTMTSGKSVAIIRAEYERHRYHIRFPRGFGAAGSVPFLLMYLDEGLLGAPTSNIS